MDMLITLLSEPRSGNAQSTILHNQINRNIHRTIRIKETAESENTLTRNLTETQYLFHTYRKKEQRVKTEPMAPILKTSDEDNPDLKNGGLFMLLQCTLERTEHRIASAKDS